MINWLINRAKRTPYFHLDGYMNRWWLVPYNKVIHRATSKEFMFLGQVGREDHMVDDGTGPVTWRRPLAKLLQLCGIAVRVHEILRSDIGRDPHDHPFNFVTIILKGGYYEHLYNDEGFLVSTTWHGPGSILYRPASTWHKLTLPKGETATTLFISGQKQGRWGFNVMGTKIPHNQYQRGEE